MGIILIMILMTMMADEVKGGPQPVRKLILLLNVHTNKIIDKKGNKPTKCETNRQTENVLDIAEKQDDIKLYK